MLRWCEVLGKRGRCPAVWPTWPSCGFLKSPKLPSANTLCDNVSPNTLLGELAMSSDGIQTNWHWGKKMLACFDELRADFAQHKPPIIDREDIPSFSGDPDGMVIWIICKHSDGVNQLETDKPALTTLLQERMGHRGFPPAAIESLFVSVTSLQDIESGGGRFYFFR